MPFQSVAIQSVFNDYRRCMSLPTGQSAVDGDPVVQWSCNPNDYNQLFTLEHVEDYWYTVSL